MPCSQAARRRTRDGELLGTTAGIADPTSAAANVFAVPWKDDVFVWLPAASADPNEGWTYGVLAVAVLTDPATGRIRHMIAPSYIYNRLYGSGGGLYYIFYPPKASRLSADAILGARTFREATVRYEDLAFGGGRFAVLADGASLRTASRRFYGIGPETPSRDATGYVSDGTRARAFLGVNLPGSWRFAVGAGFRREAIEPNIVPGVGEIAARFPGLPGLRPQNTVTQTALVSRDDRDLPATPSKGSRASFFATKTTRAWGSDSDYFRFFDRGRVALNLEQRATLSRRNIMGVRVELQVAPFVDVGTVFPRPRALRGKDLRPVLGSALRFVAKPNVVASLDAGFGSEGPALFLGLDYPL